MSGCPQCREPVHAGDSGILRMRGLTVLIHPRCAAAYGAEIERREAVQRAIRYGADPEDYLLPSSRLTTRQRPRRHPPSTQSTPGSPRPSLRA